MSGRIGPVPRLPPLPSLCLLFISGARPLRPGSVSLARSPLPCFLCVSLCVSILLPSISSLSSQLSSMFLPLSLSMNFSSSTWPLNWVPNTPHPIVSQAAKLPMSIIIIGVGQAEFDGESLPLPRCSPTGSDPGGWPCPAASALSPACVIVRVCRQGSPCVCLHGGHVYVRVCAPSPHPSAVERRPESLLPPPTL